MEKYTERNINDSVWVMFQDRTCNARIDSIHYTKFLDPVDNETINERIDYYVNVFEERSVRYGSDQVFSTREELINSL